MRNKEYQNQLRYWRNTLADAARVEIPVDSLTSIRDPRIDFQVGQIDQKQADGLIDLVEKQLNDKKGLKNKSELGWKAVGDVQVLLAPFRVSPVPKYTRLSGERGIFYPFWIRAILDRTGCLRTDDDPFPYIPRLYLEPQVNQQINFVFSSIDIVDEAFSKPFVESPRWHEYWQYIQQTFRAVTGKSMDEYSQENYTANYQPTLVVNELLTNAADAIIGLYDSLLHEQSLSPLLGTLANLAYEPLKPVLTPAELVTASAKHVGQMGHEHALSLSQRKSLYHLNQVGEGTILAVNGPPGTGKTTLLQSIVANEVVKHALIGGEPAVILACSTNNQAVTNIIDSFSTVKPKAGLLYERWLPKLTGFGVYLPSESKVVDPTVLHLKRRQGGFHREIENEPYLAEAEHLFTSQYNQYYGESIRSVDQIIEQLQTKLKAAEKRLQEGIRSWSQYQTMEQLVVQLGPLPFVQWPDNDQLKQLEDLLKALENQVSTYLDNESFWIKLFSFLKPIKEKRATRLKQLFRDSPVEYPSINAYDLKTVHAFFDTKFKLIKQIRDLNTAWADWKMANLIKGNPPIGDEAFRRAEQDRQPYFYDELERGLKYDMFYLAVHYWEGRWITATRQALDRDQLAKQGIEHSKNRWHRFAMLTPCFVSTFYTAPRFFTYSKFVTKTASGNVYENPPLQAFIDLLIVDEAGQVSPEVGGATFALARRSLVVGDTLQIEPVWNVPKKVDYANLVRYQLIRSADDQAAIDDLLDKGFLSSSGSLMKLAQKASAYQLYPQGERGMLLTEHRRCFDEIIDYCNRLAYNGLLEPKKGSAGNAFVAPMQFIPTTGDSIPIGSSRGNLQQASQIADWLRDNRHLLLLYYQQQEVAEAAKQNRAVQEIKLSAIIGIITPFASQKYLLRTALQRIGIDTVGLTIGTVHALQGAERPIILFSSTYGENDEGKSFFFDVGVNMLNVAVSRAKEAFLFFGSRILFEGAGNTPSKQLYKHIQRVNKKSYTKG